VLDFSQADFIRPRTTSVPAGYYTLAGQVEGVSDVIPDLIDILHGWDTRHTIRRRLGARVRRWTSRVPFVMWLSITAGPLVALGIAVAALSTLPTAV
jgi:hypothetical protein